MSIDIEKFIDNLQRDSEGHIVLNMFDNSILHDSFLESALRCSAPIYERKPKNVRFVRAQNPWHGITYFTDKVSLLPKIGYDKVDLFGRATDKPLELKSSGMNDYMFHIAIENAQRPNYFADKIYDCFVVGAVPIYWGAPNIGDFFDEKGILQFNTPDELAKILQSLSEEKYHSMFEHVKNNFELVERHLSPDDAIYESTIKHLRER